LNTRGFKSLAAFDDLLSRVLSLRDHSTPVYALKLSYRHFIHPDIVKTMIEYAVSHHVQRLKTSIICDIQRFLPCLLSSQTLTSLNLNVHDTIRNSRMVFPNSLNLPALTTLTLKQFYFLSDHNGCAEPFSAFNNLKTLILVSCNVLDKDDVLQQQQQEVLCISSATLVNLTILACNHIRKLKLSAPSLSGFYNETEDSAFLLSWLVELANIKSLKVSSNTLQVLSFLPDLFKLKFTSLCNLESLQVQMVPLPLALYDALKAKYLEEKGVEFYLYQNTFIPDGVVDFLIQNSPSAKVNIIPFKVICAFNFFQ
ncbi:F-box family protein, partial [Trifolium medium]|nr:F-box family protein [Trifolium medium]